MSALKSALDTLGAETGLDVMLAQQQRATSAGVPRDYAKVERPTAEQQLQACRSCTVTLAVVIVGGVYALTWLLEIARRLGLEAWH